MFDPIFVHKPQKNGFWTCCYSSSYGLLFSSDQTKKLKLHTSYILEGVEYEQAFNPHFGMNLTNHFVFTVESWFKKDFRSDKNLSWIEILSYFKHKKTLEKFKNFLF